MKHAIKSKKGLESVIAALAEEEETNQHMVAALAKASKNINIRA